MNHENREKVRSRRSHRKSRLGCGNCKKRRVKCDEKKPICGNCMQHAISCDFSTLTPTASSSERSTPPRQYAFRPSKYQALASSPAPAAVQEESSPPSISSCNTPSPPSTPPISGLSIPDLQLFHYFITSTYRTVADSAPATHTLWQIHVPKWGMSFPSIMHLLLALSALHLASLHPEEKESFTRQADEHFTFGVRSVTTVLALNTLDSDNCQQVYISAVMICFAYFARGAREGEYLVFNEKGKSEWLVLLHGVRAIMEQKRQEIFTGVLAPTENDPGLVSKSGIDLRAELQRHRTRLREIRDLVLTRVANTEEGNIYTSVVDDLVRSFEQAYQTRERGCSALELMASTMGWTFRLLPTMIDRLEEKEPVALIILAHWAILLRFMREIWFMRGWDEHLITGIRACLPGEYAGWVEWPEEVIRS
ncbi:hypothetical protein BJX61DRAFT_532591 [Aspergillus egyptiacus]|nr:hypothetical protein BJX61DRAFT_532591 [Aspergillus egyptiacus]